MPLDISDNFKKTAIVSFNPHSNIHRTANLAEEINICNGRNGWRTLKALFRRFIIIRSIAKTS